jgi:hypothetical protein
MNHINSTSIINVWLKALIHNCKSKGCLGAAMDRFCFIFGGYGLIISKTANQPPRKSSLNIILYPKKLF